MKESLMVIIGFMKKEFAQALRDPVMKVFIFVAPVIQLAIFGYAIDNEFKNLKLAVFRAPADVVARQVETSLYAGGWFLPVDASVASRKFLDICRADFDPDSRRDERGVPSGVHERGATQKTGESGSALEEGSSSADFRRTLPKHTAEGMPVSAFTKTRLESEPSNVKGFARHHTNDSPEEILQAGKADAVLIMPVGGLTKAYGKNEAVMQLLIDSQNATKARAVDRYVRSIIQKFAAGKNSQEQFKPPVTFDVRVLYNPTLETSIFMVPGIMTLIMSLITIIMTSMALAREKEVGTFETIIAAPVFKWEIILGKTAPFFILGLIDAIIILSAGKILFDVPIRGSMFYLIFATIVYIMTTVSIGLLVSSIAINQQQAMMGTFMFEFPAILLSGVIFPIENMPWFMQAIAKMNPLMYYVKVIRNVMLKGANPDLVMSCISALMVIGLVVVISTILRFKQKLA